MADVITNIANQGELNSWLSGLPGTDDGNVHIGNITVAGDYTLGEVPLKAVAYTVRADVAVKYNFDSPTDPHVAIVSTTQCWYPRSTTMPCKIEGMRLETSSTTLDIVQSGTFEDSNIVIEKCRLIGGNNGCGNARAGATVHVENCVISGTQEFGIRGASVGVTSTHTVVTGCNLSGNSFRGGIQTTSGAAFDSTVAFNNSNKDWFDTNATANNIASGDATAFGASAVTGVVAGDFTNTASNIWTSATGGSLDGTGSGGTDIGLQLAAANTITITTPQEWVLIARSKATNTSDITIAGAYSGAIVPTAIEASFNGGAFVTIDASPTGGSYSGSLTGQSSGHGDLVVRFVNDNSIASTRENVAIGIKALFWGQSNFSGRANNAQSYTGTTGFFHKYTVTNDVWEGGVDPFDTATALGSLFPLLANLIVTDKSVPVGFIGVAEGSTTLSQWQSGQTLNTRMLDYLTNSGGSDIELIASWIGESDAGAGTTETDFKNQYNAVINQLETLTGIKSLICGIAQPGTAQDDVRLWTSEIASTNANVVGYVDMNLVFQALHYTTDQQTADTAQALYDGINLAFFSSTAAISITGIPDGTYTTALDDESGNRLFYGNLAYSSESANQTIEVDAGTRVKGYVDDNSTPSVNGAYIELVTS